MTTALISVYDKTGLAEFARRLKKLKFKIISTGKTAEFLRKGGVEVVEVSEHTGFPEILGGRVKTLHPKIHAGILARKNQTDDIKTLEKLDICPINLVVVNLYPFESEPSIENIDIGGPALLRAAAKNFEAVTVVCDPADYERVAEALEKGGCPLEMRRELAGKVFAKMAQYESATANFFGPKTGQVKPLRYGENPHQIGMFHFAAPEDLLWREPLQGKELSYNNILDTDSAWWLIREFKEEPFACAVIKHTNPCGVAVSKKSLGDAFEKALACDSQSAFGGIAVFNWEVDRATAEGCAKIFLEVILAPTFSKEALKILATKKNLRLLEMRDVAGPAQWLRSAGGGLLLQDADRAMEDPSKWTVKTKRKPTPQEMKGLQFSWKVVKHVKSNAIVFSSDDQTLGIGAGQMSRIDSVKIGTIKMKQFLDINTSTHQHIRTIVSASDAFFPFPDNIEAIANAGATAVIQPGGSIKDNEVIQAADQYNLAMVFTGVRHFRH